MTFTRTATAELSARIRARILADPGEFEFSCVVHHFNSNSMVNSVRSSACCYDCWISVFQWAGKLGIGTIAARTHGGSEGMDKIRCLPFTQRFRQKFGDILFSFEQFRDVQPGCLGLGRARNQQCVYFCLGQPRCVRDDLCGKPHLRHVAGNAQARLLVSFCQTFC